MTVGISLLGSRIINLQIQPPEETAVFAGYRIKERANRFQQSRFLSHNVFISCFDPSVNKNIRHFFYLFSSFLGSILCTVITVYLSVLWASDIKKLNICDIRVILVGVVAYHKQKTKECVVCEKWSPTREFLKQYLGEIQNSYLQSVRLREVEWWRR